MFDGQKKPVVEYATRHELANLQKKLSSDIVNENDTLRREFSYDVTRRVQKRVIVGFARRHPEIRERYLREVERRLPQPYDFERDRFGLAQWYNPTLQYSQSNHLSLVVTSRADFLGVIDTMLDAFANFVENNRGWELLWLDDQSPRDERAAQLLFLGIVMHYCRANDIDISPETNIGRGPVDFKVARGFALRAALEMKLVRNGKFWNGLERQLPTYMTAEAIDVGYFIAIAFTEKDIDKLAGIAERVSRVNWATGYDIRFRSVNALRNPPSASRL